MVYKSVFLFLYVLLYRNQLLLDLRMEEPIIHIGIMHREAYTVTLYGTFKVNGSIEQSSGTYEVYRKKEKIYFEGKSYECLELSPLDEESAYFELSDVVIGIDFHWERSEKQRFQGSLRFVKDHNMLVAINELTLEKYLLSVISSEMSATASLSLLKAHAVISRSWLMAQLERSRKKADAIHCIETDEERIKWYDRDDHTLYDVCADDHCQRYQGISRATSLNVAKAVEETKGEVLVYENEICDARFSKCCGGVSEQFSSCWEEKNFTYLQPVRDVAGNDLIPDLSQEEIADRFIRTTPDAFCHTTDREILNQVLNEYDRETSDFYRWTVTYTQSEMADLIRFRSGIDFGKIIDIIPLKRGTSGRITRLKIRGEKKTYIIGKELEIRKTLSPTHLYSAAFVIDKNNIISGVPGTFLFTGAGWGHGVGLCQIGAAVMGASGYSYREILSHYFREAEVTVFYK